MGLFEDFVNLELPRRTVMFTNAIIGVTGNPNLSGNSTINNAPQGTFYIDDASPKKTLWKKNDGTSTGWVLANSDGNVASLTNDNAGAITQGQPVYVSSDGAVDLAATTTLTTAKVVGFVHEPSVASAAAGEILTDGLATVPTGLQDGGAWLFGDKIYLSSTPGNLTKTVPATPGIEAPVGICANTPAGGDATLIVNFESVLNLTTTVVGSGAGGVNQTAVQVGTYTAQISDLVRVDPSGGGFTVDLVTAVGNTDAEIWVKNTTSSTNTVTLDPDGSETIDGAATLGMSTGFQIVKLRSDGANWMRVD